MHAYELVTVGQASGRTVAGWARAKREARLEAARVAQAVSIWRVHPQDAALRELRATTMPDGAIVVERPLHRRPQLL
jgi:hypothetical protein